MRYLLYIFLTITILTLVLEFVLGTFVPQNLREKGPFFLPEPKLPLGFYPSSRDERHIRKKSDGSVVFDVQYSFDEFNRRITFDNNLKKEKVVLFFGDSFTFGEGVSDKDSVPFIFSKKFPQYKTYNYAYRGYGPQQMLVKIQQGFSENELLSLPGVAYFMVFNFQVKRVAVVSDVLAWSGGVHPHYTLDENGDLRRAGFQSTVYPIFSFLSWHLANTQIAKFFNLSYPSIKSEDYKKFCKTFEEASRGLEKMNIKLQLFSFQPKQWLENEINCLPESLKIQFVPNFEIDNYLIKGDGHLNEKGTQFVVDWLVEKSSFHIPKE